MIVYRDQRCLTQARPLLKQLRSSLERLDLTAPDSHDATVDAFITAGTLETAIADVIFRTADGIHPLTAALREVTVGLGHVLWHSWCGTREQADRWRWRAAEGLNIIAHHALPSTVGLTVPEGFAYYAVYPEAYLESARNYHARFGDTRVVCIGLRSIGSALSGVVAAALEELGTPVRSFTLRPRGHPFSRRPVLEPVLQRQLVEDAEARFLLIDEGPGISGSSLAGTAAYLGQLGVSDDRIVLFPSWKTDGAHLRSDAARERWPRHLQFSVGFDELWMETGRLGSSVRGWCWKELSAGRWRDSQYPDPSDYPAVQPQHERRKYLLHSSPDQSCGSKLLSFSGLGTRSETILRRAEQVAEAGFTPRPEGVVHGFLIRPFVPGVPARPDRANAALVQTVAEYLAYLSTQQGTTPTVSSSSLREMVETNVAEGLGEAWQRAVDSRLPGDVYEWAERPVALDGRMLVHEWIRTRDGYLKVDAFDHHDDHFFPGCQDIAWDVAGAVFELRLDPSGRRTLIERYRQLSRDGSIAARLPHYALAYLAYRMGYASLATTILGSSPDGRRFAAETRRYGDLLRCELTQSPAVAWDV